MSDKEYKNPITVKEEEIDLGKLFEMIGKTFQKLFNFIFFILKEAFHFLILILIFIKNHIFKVFLAAFLGALLGFGIDYISPQEYTYDMLIEPNYKSIDEVYEKLEYYNVLIDLDDSISLAKEFNISYNLANKISSFELVPYESEKDQILAYDNFIKATDTLTHKLFSFKDFRGIGTSKLDSRLYVYRMKSYLPYFPSLEKQILTAIGENELLKKRRKIQKNTIKLDSIATRIALKDIDSLRSLYKKVTLLEVNKSYESSASTYIDFAKESSSNNDVAFFKITKSLNENLIKLEVKKETTDNIINVISSFNPAGKKTGTFFQTKMYNLGLLFSLIMTGLILVIKFNKYLKSYQANNN